MKQVHLHIDSLVLRGFRPEDRHGIAAGLQQELNRIFSDPQAAQQLAATGDVSRLSIGSIKIAQGAKPQHVGSQVARNIGRRMER
jgi:hypothetical protein